MEWLQNVNRWVWGVPTLLLILTVGVLLSAATRFAQFRFLPKALRSFLKPGKDGDHCDGESPFRALCTALAATVGTGNLVGVAGAISIGGPGAVFWIWVGGLLGMVTKFAEATLAVHYRKKCAGGEYIGGPMYIITNAMPRSTHFLAYIYAFFGVVAAFGVGNATQINTMIGGINSVLSYFDLNGSFYINLLFGLCMALLVCILFFGGAKRIGATAETLVPLGAVIYVLLGLGVFIARYDAIPGAFASILRGAISPKAVTGGMVGSAMITLRVGTSRGVFTNEAGMGTAGIAHAAAKVKHPVDQGMMGIVEVFIDTIVICTITALVILCSGVSIIYGEDMGMNLTTDAFSSVYGGWVTILLAATLCLFAFATVIGWGLYGVRCAQFLFGEGVWRKFAILQSLSVVLGAVLRAETVWLLADTVNGLMAIPNLIALIYLLPSIRLLVNDYGKGKD